MTETKRLKEAVRHIEQPLPGDDDRTFAWWFDWERDPEPETFLSRRFPAQQRGKGNRSRKCVKGNMPNKRFGAAA